eukprot:4774877-Prymnesium_polylepis.1
MIVTPKGSIIRTVDGPSLLARSRNCLEKKTAAGLAQFFYAITIESRISAGQRTVDGAAFAHRTAMAPAPERRAVQPARAKPCTT